MTSTPNSRAPDELAAAPAPPSRAAPENAAIAYAARADDAIARADLAAVSGSIAELAEIFDHRTGASFGRAGWLAGFYALVEAARDPESRHEPLATLGDSLGLFHRSVSASGLTGRTPDVGSYRIEELDLIEADERGCCTWAELFAVDRLSRAITRLYERHAERLAEPTERARAAAIARAVALLLAPPDADAIGRVLALDMEYNDTRMLGWGPARGVIAFRRGLRAVVEAARDVATRTDEILGLRADALLVRRTLSGIQTYNGEPFHRSPLALWAFGADGRLTRWEHFDAEDRETAIARFEELSAPPTPPRIVENAATRSLDAASPRATAEVLATRGERLAIAHTRADASRVPPLELIELDRAGRRLPSVRFDAAERESALAELDARYARGEAAEHPAMWSLLSALRRALSGRSWNELTALFSPDLRAEDHRLFGWGTANSPVDYVTAVRSLSDLAPDVSLRADHLLLAERAALFVTSWIGGQGTGAFAIPVVAVFGMGRDGRIAHAHHYSVEQIDAARARLAELA